MGKFLKYFRLTVAFAATISLASFWRRAAPEANMNGLEKPHDVTVSYKDDSEAMEEESCLTDYVKNNYATVSMVYNTRDGEQELSLEDLKYAPQDDIKFKVLKEHHDRETGFYGALYESEATGKKSLVFSGVDFNFGDIKGLTEFAKDFDDALIMASGTASNQVGSMLEFCKDLKSQNCIPDIVIGHSLGGYLAQYSAGVEPFGHSIPTIVYDAPGVNNNSLTAMKEISGDTRKTIAERLKDNVVSVKISANCFNSMGKQVGTHLTVKELYESQELPWERGNIIKKMVSHLVPENHVHNTYFRDALYQAEKFSISNVEHESPARRTASVLVLSLVTLLASPEILKRIGARKLKQASPKVTQANDIEGLDLPDKKEDISK